MPPFFSHAGASDISLQQEKKKGGVWEEQSGVGMVGEPAEGMEGSRDGMWWARWATGMILKGEDRGASPKHCLPAPEARLSSEIQDQIEEKASKREWLRELSVPRWRCPLKTRIFVSHPSSAATKATKLCGSGWKKPWGDVTTPLDIPAAPSTVPALPWHSTNPWAEPSPVSYNSNPKFTHWLEHWVDKKSILKKPCSSALTSPISQPSWLKLLLLHHI